MAVRIGLFRHRFHESGDSAGCRSGSRRLVRGHRQLLPTGRDAVTPGFVARAPDGDSTVGGGSPI